MRHSLRPAVLAVLGLAILSLAACNKGGSAAMSADEQAIRGLNAHWITVINNKDASASAAMYADDGGIYAPNEPPAIGHEAVLATWTNILQIPGMSLDLHTDKIRFAASKDLAVETGMYTLKSGDVNAPTVENGKYVVTWVKRDNAWKVYTDMFSSDTAPPPAKPAEASAPMMSPQPAMPDNQMPGMMTTPDSTTAPGPNGPLVPDGNILPGQSPVPGAAPESPMSPSSPDAAPASPSGSMAPSGQTGSTMGATPAPMVEPQQFGPAKPTEQAAPLAPTGEPAPIVPNATPAPATPSSPMAPAPSGSPQQ
jgi:uncharacterized protein (TIGR02246 family)